MCSQKPFCEHIALLTFQMSEILSAKVYREGGFQTLGPLGLIRMWCGGVACSYQHARNYELRTSNFIGHDSAHSPFVIEQTPAKASRCSPGLSQNRCCWLNMREASVKAACNGRHHHRTETFRKQYIGNRTPHHRSSQSPQPAHDPGLLALLPRPSRLLARTLVKGHRVVGLASSRT